MNRFLTDFYKHNRLPLFFLAQNTFFWMLYMPWFIGYLNNASAQRLGVETIFANRWFLFIYSMIVAILALGCIITAFFILKLILDKKTHWAWIVLIVLSSGITIETKAAYTLLLPFVFGSGLIW